MDSSQGKFHQILRIICLNTETKVFKNLVKKGQGPMCYAIFVDILTLISSFSNFFRVVSMLYLHIVTAFCYCFGKHFIIALFLAIYSVVLLRIVCVLLKLFCFRFVKAY